MTEILTLGINDQCRQRSRIGQREKLDLDTASIENINCPPGELRNWEDPSELSHAGARRLGLYPSV